MLPRLVATVLTKLPWRNWVSGQSSPSSVLRYLTKESSLLSCYERGTNLERSTIQGAEHHQGHTDFLPENGRLQGLCSRPLNRLTSISPLHFHLQSKWTISLGKHIHSMLAIQLWVQLGFFCPFEQIHQTGSQAFSLEGSTANSSLSQYNLLFGHLWCSNRMSSSS
jgi:hypothetical protein